MPNSYFNKFISNFIDFTTPKGKSFFILTETNRAKLFSQKKRYDYIFFINTLEKEHDIISLLNITTSRLTPGGRLIITCHNYLYSFLKGQYKLNWLSLSDIKNFLKLASFEPLTAQPLCFFPIYIPILSPIFNHILLFIFPFNHLSYLYSIVATKKTALTQDVSSSIIIPARNEEGNIKNLFKSLPQIGKKTEIIFIEGHSRDNTREEIKNNILRYKSKNNFSYQLLIQKGSTGKSGAVNIGFKNARGDIMIIYDSDMTVKPGDLLKFYQALITHQGDFINGSRLVYPIQTSAMQSLNIFGNKLFSLLYSWLFGQPVKDTLCGTKAFWRKDYLLFSRSYKNISSLDPFGDFYLLYCAARLNLKIIDLPVRYFARSYGATNIKRFKNAWQLFKFSLFALKNYKMRL